MIIIALILVMGWCNTTSTATPQEPACYYTVHKFVQEHYTKMNDTTVQRELLTLLTPDFFDSSEKPTVQITRTKYQITINIVEGQKAVEIVTGHNFSTGQPLFSITRTTQMAPQGNTALSPLSSHTSSLASFLEPYCTQRNMCISAAGLAMLYPLYGLYNVQLILTDNPWLAWHRHRSLKDLEDHQEAVRCELIRTLMQHYVTVRTIGNQHLCIQEFLYDTQQTLRALKTWHAITRCLSALGVCADQCNTACQDIKRLTFLYNLMLEELN